MQTKPTRWNSIIAGSHYFETKVTIDGHDIDSEDILSLTTTVRGMAENKPSVGGALSAVLDLKILEPNFTIPKLAQIVVKVRVCNATQQSGWLNQGTFFIDTRQAEEAVRDRQSITISAFDAMMKAEADYPDTSHAWPFLDKSVVAEIATAIGVTVDARTNSFLTTGYMINLPAGYTMRETLEHIAACYGGNFIVTKDNKLLFVPLYGLDNHEDGRYLADENGNALTFGNEGWFIFV